MQFPRSTLSLLLFAVLASPALADQPCPTDNKGTGAQDQFETIAPVMSEIRAQAECKATGPIGPEQFRRFYALTEEFETSKPDPDYGILSDWKAGDPGDGRGYCAGLVSFCSNTDDMADVIKEYTKLKPKNPLWRFVPTMEELSKANRSDVKGLEGLAAAWNSCHDDPLFHQAQEIIRTKEYLDPALKIAKDLGINTVLGRFILYDTAVQHGVGGTYDLVKRLKKNHTATPASKKISEKAWLIAFLKVRKAELVKADDPRTQEVWADSAPRADALTHMVEDGFWDFCGPIKVRSHDWNLILQ